MKCRVCDSDDLYLYYTQGNQSQFHFHKCRECGLVNYDLSGGIDQDKYTNNYVDPLNDNARTNIGHEYTWRFIKENLTVNGRFLDIGCGNGKLLILAARHGWTVEGLELSDFYATKLKQTAGIPVHVVDFIDFNPGENEKYDLITLRHVFEHLPDPVKSIRKIKALLNPGGHVLMEFPNIESMEAKNKRFLSRLGIRKKKYDSVYKPGHCNEFSRRSFSYLLDKTGFNLVIWETYSMNPILNFIYKFFPVGSKARVLIRKRD
ncbi:MAG: class I SAM-dependent methyltransferase [Bacteroidales bacterium]